MFWGLVLEPSKKYTQKVDQTFHISQAALDLKSCDLEPIQLVLEYENSNFVLCTLSKKANIFQVPLDLTFKTGDQVSFRTIGNGKVHLSGYHILEDLDSVLMNGEEESDVEELEEINEVTKETGKRKKPALNLKGKKAKLDFNEDESEDDDEDDEDDDLDEDEEDSEDDLDEDEAGAESPTAGKKPEKKNQKINSLLSSLNDDEDEDDEDDDDDDEDDDDEEDEDDDDDDEDDDFEVDDSDDVSMKLDDKKSKKGPTTPNGLNSSLKGKDKSAQKLNKSKQGTPKPDGKTPKSEKKNDKKPGNTDTPQRKNSEGSKKEDKSPKSEGSPLKKVLEGGLISEEIKVGNGPVAKPGKMANVYYVGTLASTKKEFDSVQSGGGFKFRVGRNEVIKGWDIGVVGMKVGGKRKLTIPPHLAYGSKGSPPVIPPNSTLVFTVELKGLS